MPTTKLTKAFIKKAAWVPSGSKQQIHWDTEIRGFGLVLNEKGSKSYVVQRRVNGKDCRRTIGRASLYEFDEARQKARKLIVAMVDGTDPRRSEEYDSARNVTFQEAFEEYLNKRTLRPKTVADYRSKFVASVGDWANRRLLDITKEEASKRYQKLRQKGSKAYATSYLKIPRQAFNFAKARYLGLNNERIFEFNPFDDPTYGGRDAFEQYRRPANAGIPIPPKKLKAWFSALYTLRGSKRFGGVSIVRQYLLFMLFTGLRRREAAMLKWTDVDFTNYRITIPETNSKNKKEHQLPMSTYMENILAPCFYGKRPGNEYVFHSSGPKGYLTEPMKAIRRIAKESNIPFTAHDLRRTFASYANEIGIQESIIRRALNHSAQSVTARYIKDEEDRIREAMQNIGDFILQRGGFGKKRDAQDPTRVWRHRIVIEAPINDVKYA